MGGIKDETGHGIVFGIGWTQRAVEVTENSKEHVNDVSK